MSYQLNIIQQIIKRQYKYNNFWIITIPIFWIIIQIILTTVNLVNQQQNVIFYHYQFENMFYLLISILLIILSLLLLYFVLFEKKKIMNMNSNRIQQLRAKIAPKLENNNQNEISVQTQTGDLELDYKPIYDKLYKSRDAFEILELQLKDRIKFRKSVKQLIIFYLRQMLLKQNTKFPDKYRSEDQLNYQQLESLYKLDKYHIHFKTQQNFIQSVILKQIIYLYDMYFFSDLIVEDFRIYQQLRGNAIKKVEQKLNQVNTLFNHSDVGSPQLNYFKLTRYNTLSKVSNYNNDYDIELSTVQFNVVYDNTKVGETSLNPSNTSRFFDLLESKLLKMKGQSQIKKEIVIGPDKLLTTALEKISRSKGTEENAPQFYNLIKDLKRFTLNFKEEQEIKKWTEYLTQTSMFGENLKGELNFETQIPNLQGGLDTLNQKVHVMSVKNMFACEKSENVYKDLKIIFEVYVIESGLVFQVELQCNLQAFADWKATDHIFYDIHRTEDEFDQIHAEYQEFLQQENNYRIIFVFLIFGFLFCAITMTLIIGLFLDSFYEAIYNQYGLSLKYVRYLGQKHRILGNHQESFKQYQNINENPDHEDEDLYTQAEIFIDNNKEDYSINVLENLNSKDPNNIKYILKLAEIYQKYKEDQIKSEEYYKKVLKIDKNNIESNIGLGNVYLRTNKSDEGERKFDIAKWFDPKNVKIYIEFGKSYKVINNQEKAITNFKSAIEIDSNNIEAQIEIGNIQRIKKNFEDSKQQLKKAIKIDSKNIEALNQIGILQQDMGIISKKFDQTKKKQRKAIKNFEQSIKLVPKSQFSKIGKGQVYLINDEQEKAIQSFNKVILNDPENLDALFMIGKSYEQLLNQDKAIEYIFKVAQINPQYIDPQYIDYKDSNKYMLTVINEIKSVRISQLNIDAQIELGKVYILSKQQGKAIDLFEKSKLDDSILCTNNNSDCNIVKQYNSNRLLILGQAQFKIFDEKNLNLNLNFKKAIEIQPRNQELFNEIGEFQQKNNIQEKAIKYYNISITIEYKNINALIGLGEVQIKKYEYDEAIKNFNKVIEIDNLCTIAYIKLINVYSNKKLQDEAKKNQIKAIEIEPTNTDAQIEFGILMENKKDYQEAIKYYQKAIKLKSKYINAQIHIGKAYQKINELKYSNSQFDRAINFDPKKYKTQIDLGQFYYQNNEQIEAINLINKAIEIDPKNTQAQILKGQVQQSRQEYDESSKTIEIALKIDPYCLECMFEKGYLYQLKKEYDESIKYNKTILKIDPDNFRVINNIALSQLFKEDQNKAEINFEKSIEINPQYVYTQIEKGKMYRQEKENSFDKAIKLFEKQNFDQIYNKDECLISILYEKGKTYFHKSEAIKQFLKIIEIDPSQINAYFGLVKVQIAKKDQDNATKYTEKILNIEPKNKSALKMLSKIDFERRQIEEIINKIDKDIEIDPNNRYENMNDQKIEDDIKQYIKESEIKPNEFEAQQQIGKILFYKKRQDESIMYFDKAININPNQYSFIGIVRSLIKKHEMNKAIENCNKAIKIDPKKTDAQILMGKAQLLNGQQNEAINQLETKSYPNYIEEFILLGDSYLMSGNLELSIIKQNSVLYFESKNSIALKKLGNAYLFNENFKEAEKTFKALMEINPKEAQIEIANVNLLKGNIDETIKSFEKVIEFDENNYKAFNNIGNMQLMKKDQKNSINQYKKVIQINPNQIEAFIGLGNNYLMKEDQDKSIQQYNKCLEINPNLIIALNGIAESQFNLQIEQSIKTNNFNNITHEIENSIKYYRKALDIEPKNQLTMIKLGNSLIWNLELDKAIKYFKNSIDINRYSIESYIGIGSAQLQKREPEDAIVQQKKALGINPNNVTGLIGFGFASKYFKEQGDQKSFWSKALEINSIEAQNQMIKQEQMMKD